ncbi:DUF3412 domain-containing protein, partial [Escherichia coli]|nr:DUF3412 domain-containing protein [Escherichia coli]
IDDPAEVARIMKRSMEDVRLHRKEKGDAYSFNWSLKIEPDFQLPFDPTHTSMEGLNLNLDQEPQVLAANLRKAFSG